MQLTTTTARKASAPISVLTRERDPRRLAATITETKRIEATAASTLASQMG